MSHKAPAALLAAYGSSIVEPVARATFYTPDGDPVQTLSVTGGTYSDRSDRWPRVECDIRIAAALTAAATSAPVSPYGGTVRLDVGARIAGRELTFGLATLDVVETAIDRPSGDVTIRAASREARVNEDRYPVRDATAAGASSAVVTGIVRRTFPGLPVVSQLTNDPVLAAGAYPLDGDVWPTIEQILDEAGGEALFRADGSLLMRPAPVRASTPVLTFRTGETGAGTLTGYRSTRGWAYNKVAIKFVEATGAAPGVVVGVWEDTTSTTGTGTAYGRHTYRETRTVDAGKLPTQARANAAAASLGKRRQDTYRTVQLRALPAQWITPGDTIGSELLGGMTERLLVVGVEFPLDGLDVMTVDARDPAYTGSN